MAPASMSPEQFFRVGELAELTACDRANTYKITEVTIEQALEKGWRRDDVLEFLRDNSQIGLPENVETTLRGWMGHHGDVEFHDVTLLTVHRSQIRRLESCRALKPYLLHRFVPGMYAVDRNRMAQLNVLLMQNGFSPSPSTRRYPDDPAQVESRERLIAMVNEARTSREDLVRAAHNADSDPEDLQLVAGASAGRKGRKKKKGMPPRVSAEEASSKTQRGMARTEGPIRHPRPAAEDARPRSGTGGRQPEGSARARGARHRQGCPAVLPAYADRTRRGRGGVTMSTETPRSFEEALSELELRVRRLDSGELPLEEALQVFEEGVA